MLKRSVLTAIIVANFSVHANNVNRSQYQLFHADEEITVDGQLNEAIWQSATKMDLGFENNPGEGTLAPVKTEIYFFEDGDAFNVAIIAYDPEPEKIRASLRDRDSLWADDNVGIILDTFNDERTAYEFFVNPLGAQADMRMDDTNGWQEDDSWDAIWESAGRITEEGYIVEMKIPFNALRFPEKDGRLTWNVAGWRNYPRDVRVQMATHKSDRNIECNICQFVQLEGFESVKPSNNFQLTPTLTVSRRDEKPDLPGEWVEGNTDVEPGLDLRWGITQDMVLNATINPDFSQVEADSSQLDVNNTFSLFFPEKRSFFLDGASYFETSNFNFVHTRNIADPDVGLKLTGKTNQHTYGVMVANDNNTSFLMPGSQGSGIATLEEKSEVAVARYKVDVGDRNNVGVLVTHREGDDYRNSLVSVDGSYWFTPSHSVTYQVAQSDSKNPDSVIDDFNVMHKQEDHAYSINYAQSTRDYNLRAGYTNVGEDFRADLGFHSRVNYEKLVLGGRHTWYGDSDDTFTRWGVFGDWDKTYDQQGNKIEQEIEIHGNLQGQKQFFTNFGIVHRERFYDEEYFDETQFMMFAKFVPISGLELGSFINFGKQIDFANTALGDKIYWEGFINWDVNEHVSVEVDYNYNRLDVDNGTLFTANQIDFRLGYQFDMRSILKLVVQYTDIARNADLYQYDEIDDRPDEVSRYFSTQLIYSYKINPQTLFFIGYSDGGFQDDSLQSLERDQRTIFTKFSYAWQL